MSIVRVKYRDENGTGFLFHCPVCDHYVKSESMLWERSPTNGDPGKAEYCRFCKGIWRTPRKHLVGA
jgi:hypothetical protein